MTRVVVPAPISCYVFIEQSDPMLPRLILIPLLTLITAASAAGAWAQDKGTVNPKPLPPLANPNDPSVPAKELFGRKVLPAAMPTRVHGFYAHGCISGAEGLPINGDNWQVMRLSRNRYWGHPDLIALVKRLAAKAHRNAGWPGILVGDMSPTSMPCQPASLRALAASRLTSATRSGWPQ